MASVYIPGPDAAFDAWNVNFANVIAASPALYALLPADAAVISAQATAFSAALTTATDPSTRTPSAIAAKDAQRAASEGIVRPYAIQIKANLGITNEAKVSAGINPPNPTRTPVPPPDSNPLLDVIGATPGVHTLRFADSNTPSSRSKPFGAAGLQVYRALGMAPVSDPAGAAYYATVSRQPFASTFASGDNGKTCTYFARWITAKGAVGPWSPPVSMTVAS